MLDFDLWLGFSFYPRLVLVSTLHNLFPKQIRNGLSHTMAVYQNVVFVSPLRVGLERLGGASVRRRCGGELRRHRAGEFIRILQILGGGGPGPFIVHYHAGFFSVTRFY